nr:EOG090X0BTZ [Eulimnadia texana]
MMFGSGDLRTINCISTRNGISITEDLLERCAIKRKLSSARKLNKIYLINVARFIIGYWITVEEKHRKYGDDEKTLLHCLKKLSRLPIGVQHLQETGIGRTVNGMRKMDGAVGEEARELVNKWKAIVAAEDDKNEASEEEPTTQPSKEAEKSSKSTKSKENSSSLVHKQSNNGDVHKKSEASSSKSPEKQDSNSSSRKRHHEGKKESTKREATSIDDSSGRSFEEALNSFKSPSTSKSKSKDKEGKKKSSKSSDLPPAPPPAPLEIRPTDLEISPHYKPLPHRSLAVPDSPPHLHSKQKKVSDEEALSVLMTQKGVRTKVFSGNRMGLSFVPTLFDSCIRVLQENIDSLEYTGGVPYDLLKPILERASVQQLFTLEDYNPYLLEDTDELWKYHCQRGFKKAQRQELETWRELYLRCHQERDARLKNLTANIQQQMAKATPVRTTKLAYVDSVAKPPRNAAKAQMKSGASAAVAAMTKVKASTRPFEASANHNAAAEMTAEPVRAGHMPAPRASSSSSAPAAKKPRVAPLMQKTLKFIKNRYKR